MKWRCCKHRLQNFQTLILQWGDELKRGSVLSFFTKVDDMKSISGTLELRFLDQRPILLSFTSTKRNRITMRMGSATFKLYTNLNSNPVVVGYLRLDLEGVAAGIKIFAQEELLTRIQFKRDLRTKILTTGVLFDSNTRVMFKRGDLLQIKPPFSPPLECVLSRGPGVPMGHKSYLEKFLLLRPKKTKHV